MPGQTGSVYLELDTSGVKWLVNEIYTASGWLAHQIFPNVNWYWCSGSLGHQKTSICASLKLTLHPTTIFYLLNSSYLIGSATSACSLPQTSQTPLLPPSLIFPPSCSAFVANLYTLCWWLSINFRTHEPSQSDTFHRSLHFDTFTFSHVAWEWLRRVRYCCGYSWGVANDLDYCRHVDRS